VGSLCWWRFGNVSSQIVVQRPNSELAGSLRSREWCESFFGRKLSASALMTVMPAGVVTLLGALLWLPSPH
jgi:hypothetical protein